MCFNKLFYAEMDNKFWKWFWTRVRRTKWFDSGRVFCSFKIIINIWTRSRACHQLKSVPISTARSEGERVGWRGFKPPRSDSLSRSWNRPGVRLKATGLPSASQTAWILVLSPPLLRPIAWSSPSSFERQRYVAVHELWLNQSLHIHYLHLQQAT